MTWIDLPVVMICWINFAVLSASSFGCGVKTSSCVLGPICKASSLIERRVRELQVSVRRIVASIDVCRNRCCIGMGDLCERLQGYDHVALVPYESFSYVRLGYIRSVVVLIVTICRRH